MLTALPLGGSELVDEPFTLTLKGMINKISLGNAGSTKKCASNAECHPFFGYNNAWVLLKASSLIAAVVFCKERIGEAMCSQWYCMVFHISHLGATSGFSPQFPLLSEVLQGYHQQFCEVHIPRQLFQLCGFCRMLQQRGWSLSVCVWCVYVTVSARTCSWAVSASSLSLQSQSLNFASLTLIFPVILLSHDGLRLHCLYMCIDSYVASFSSMNGISSTSFLYLVPPAIGCQHNS